jgi:hypothetical protein
MTAGVVPDQLADTWAQLGKQALIACAIFDLLDAALGK